MILMNILKSKEYEVFIVFNDMIVDMLINKTIVTELYIRDRNQKFQ